MSHLQNQGELSTFRVLHLPLSEEIPHRWKCAKWKIYTFWYLVGWNEFLMTLSVISEWFDHLSRANYFGFFNMYSVINVHYSC